MARVSWPDALGWLIAALLLVGPRVSKGEDLLDVYRLARSHDPVLSAADAQRRFVREGVTQARAALLPQVSAGVSFDRSRVDGGADNSARNVSAGLSQVIVDLGRLARLDAARSQADAQDASYRAAEQALIVRVASAYFDVLTAADALANIESYEAAYLQQVEQTTARVRNGIGAQVDADRARAYHASARASTSAARQALADAREALAEITGQHPAAALNTLRDALPMESPSPADPQAWVAAALEANPLLQARRLDMAAAERGIDVARAGHLPTVSAGVAVGRGSAWPVTTGRNDGRTATTVGLSLNVPLFAGGATESQVRQAVSQRDGARDELEQRRRRIARETLEHYRAVVAGIDRIGATGAAVESAKRALESTRTGHGLGTQTMTDLLLAIQTLASAQSEHSLARHRFVLSRLLLRQAAGSVDEADLAAVNALLQ